MKTVNFSGTIAACDLKVCGSRHLINFMKVCEHWSRSFLTLAQGCVHMKIKTGISHKLLGRSYVSFQLQGNEKLFNDKVKFCN